MAKRTPKSPPPTASYVKALWESKRSDGDEIRLRDLAGSFRTLTRMEHTIDIPTGYRATTKEIRTPFIRDAWERITASLTHNPVLYHFEPSDDSDKAKRASGIGERWIQAAMARMDKELGEDTSYEACRSMVRDTESVMKLVHRPDAWATFPNRARNEDPGEYVKRAEKYKKGSPLPFARRNVDRLQLVFEDGEFGDSWCIEYGEYPRPMLMRTYGMRYDDSLGMVPSQIALHNNNTTAADVTPQDVLGGEPKPEGHLNTGTGMSIKMEYFDKEWWHVTIDGRDAPGYPKPNPYAPFLPYARAKPSAEPESVLYSLLFLVPGLDAILTGMTNWMWLGMFPNPTLQDVPNSQAVPGPMMPPTGMDQKNSTFNWRPGKMLEIPRGKAFSFMQAPPVGRDAIEMMNTIRGLIDIAGIPSVFRGLSGSGDSGYLANQMTGAVEMMYKRLAAARQRQEEYAVEFFVNCVGSIVKQTVYVMGQGAENSWLGLRSKGDTTDTLASIDQLGSIKVEVRPDQSVMAQARMMIAKQGLEGPPSARVFSQRRAMEYMGEEDPDSVIDEIWLDEVMSNDPTLNKLVIDNAVRESGLLATPPSNPMDGMSGPDGAPMIPGGVPGALSGGLPVLPGMGMPMQPPPPQGAGGIPGGPAGMFPGQPPNSPIGV